MNRTFLELRIALASVLKTQDITNIPELITELLDLVGAKDGETSEERISWGKKVLLGMPELCDFLLFNIMNTLIVQLYIDAKSPKVKTACIWRNPITQKTEQALYDGCEVNDCLLSADIIASLEGD